MKNPLRYQITEYDCGPTAFLNSVMYLYDREEIPPEFITTVMTRTLDRCNCEGVMSRGGTTSASMRYLCSWMELYAQQVKYPIVCKYLEDHTVHLGHGSEIMQCLREGGAVTARCFAGCDHYVTLTGYQYGDGSEDVADDEKELYIRIFDPYFIDEPFWKEKDIHIVEGQPFGYNLIVPARRMDNEKLGSYSFKNSEKKSAVLFKKTGTGSVIHPEFEEIDVGFEEGDGI